VQTGYFVCEICDKKCKSKGGLKLHTLVKHTTKKEDSLSSEKTLTEELLIKLLKELQKDTLKMNVILKLSNYSLDCVR